MDRYVIRDRDDYSFLKEITNKGVITTHNLTEAIIFYELEKAERLFEYLTSIADGEDYMIEEIEFKIVKEME